MKTREVGRREKEGRKPLAEAGTRKSGLTLALTDFLTEARTATGTTTGGQEVRAGGQSTATTLPTVIRPMAMEALAMEATTTAGWPGHTTTYTTATEAPTTPATATRSGLAAVSTTPTLATMEASTTIMTVAMEATIEEEMVVHQVLATATTLATMEAPTTSMTTAMAVTTEEETVLATAATSPALTTMDSVVLTVVQVDCKVEGSGPQNWEPESEMVEPGPRTRKTPTTENWTGK